MEYEDVLRKIEACLALSKSSNEHEAKAALVMARKLMAMYKISEKELNVKKISIIDLKTDIYFTKRKTLWKLELACTIAFHFRCEVYYIRGTRSQTCRLCIIGEGKDSEVCLRVLTEAVAYIEDRIRGANAGDSMSYGMGFCMGLRFAYQAQDETDKEMALVMRVPSTVTDFLNSLNATLEKSPPTLHSIMNLDKFVEGRSEGSKYLNKKIETPKHTSERVR